MPNCFLVKSQERAAGRKVVIDHVVDLSLYALDKSCQDNGIGTVVDVGQGELVPAAQMHEKPKCVHPHSPGNALPARAEHHAWANGHARKAMPILVFLD